MSDVKTLTFDIRRMGPLKDSHPLVTGSTRCPGCGGQFNEGDLITLIVVGPGPDEEARKLCRADKSFNAVALPTHWACVTGEENG